MNGIIRRLAPAAASAPALALALAALPAHAEGIRAEPVEYEVGGQTFEGYFARNVAVADLPVVLIVHDWDGLTDYERTRADMLARLGYAAFAVDVYGKGNRPETLEEKQAESGKLYRDREALRARLSGALETARGLSGVDGERAAIMGYCFGGASVLEFARAGADVDGFVSFHGGLATPDGQDYTAADGPILVLHGSADPVAPMAEVAAMAEDMNAAGVDYELRIYSGVKHSFTVWGASGGSSEYNAEADRKSWEATLSFFDDVLR